MTASKNAIQLQVTEEVLRRGYETLLTVDGELTSLSISEGLGVPLDEVDTLCEGMETRGLIERKGWLGQRGHKLWLTAAGVREAEERRVVAPQLVEKYKRLSAGLLRQLCFVRTDKGRHHPWHLMEGNGFDAPVSIQAAVLGRLIEDGLVEPFPSLKGTYRATVTGIERLHALDEQAALYRRLEEIEPLRAQIRGKRLEGVIAEALRQQGCRCDVDTGGEGEQIDIVVECCGVSHLCEAKWEKDPIQPKDIDQMLGRLNRRPANVVGVIFSMSGFSRTAPDKAARHAYHRTIFLVGADDTRAIIYGERRFSDLVVAQHRSLVARTRL